MLSRLESRWRTFRDLATPGEWMLRSLRLPRSRGTGSAPGLLVLSIEGCDRHEWTNLKNDGALPFTASLTQLQHYSEQPYYPGCAWARAAGEAEFFYGHAGGVPGEEFLDPEHHRVWALTQDAGRLRLEKELQRHDPGLCVDGSVWGAMFQGGAARADFHPEWRPAWAEKTGVDGEPGLHAQLRRWGGPALDLRRGVPLVYVRIEMPAKTPRRYWHALDRMLAALYHRAHHSRRRHYEVWLQFSPCGHKTAAFPVDLDQALQTVLGQPWQVRRVTPTTHARAGATGNEHLLWLSTGSHLAHLHAERKLNDAEKSQLATLLLDANLADGVLWSNVDGQVQWSRPENARTVAEDDSRLHALLDQDLLALTAHPMAGQLVLVRHSRALRPDSPDSVLGTVLLPGRTRLPENAGAFVRPAALRTGALHILGRSHLPARPRLRTRDAPHFRVMTYNVHRCMGMDGRRSPERVMHIIAQQEPDLLALQETGQDGDVLQSEAIAREFGLNHVYCSTVAEGDDPYGHALFSRFPMEVMKVDLLPLASEGRWKEPRGAVWAKVMVAGRPLNVFATHLGLVNADRTAQISALFGPDWMGRLEGDEAALLLGDFNLTPGGANYRRLASKLRDVQTGHAAGRHPKTFSTWHPVARLDHIFVSPHFTVERLTVPRTHLTRVASDHFPLVVDLTWSRVLAPAVAAA